jgi:hypothetical protein
MKKYREFTLKLVMSILVLALAIGAGAGYAKTQDNTGNTETGQIPIKSAGSSTGKDEVKWGIQNQGEVSSSSTTEGTTPLYSPGLQYQGTAPDENIGSITTNNPNVAFSYYLVAGDTFQGKSSTTTYAYDTYGCIHITSAADQVVIDINLPNGSVIKYLRIYYIDTNPSGYVNGYITAYEPGYSSSDLVSVSSTGSAGWGIAVSHEITHTVTNSYKAYTLIGWPTTNDNTVQLCGLRVAYYAPTFGRIALPIIRK